MRFSTSTQWHINDHKAHVGVQILLKDFIGTVDLVYDGARTHNLVLESPVP